MAGLFLLVSFSHGGHEEIEKGSLFPILKDGKWGYMDESGRVAIEPRFDEVGDFSEGIAPVEIGILWGYIDRTGKRVIEPKFHVARPFSDGLATVRIGIHWGYIDKMGNYAISSRLNDALPFSDGLAVVRDGIKWGFIDQSGSYIIGLQFDEALSFSEGMAPIRTGTTWGYVDKTGQRVIRAQFGAAYNFSDGLARVLVGDKWGFIDKTGKIVIETQFYDARDFSEGLATVLIDVKGYLEGTRFTLNPSGSYGHTHPATGRKWGYIDKTGQVVIPPKLDKAGRFSEGLAWGVENYWYRYIDKTGQDKINGVWRETSPGKNEWLGLAEAADFSHGLAMIRDSNGNSGYINKRGIFIWGPAR